MGTMSPWGIAFGLLAAIGAVIGAAITIGRHLAELQQLAKDVGDLQGRMKRIEDGNIDQGRRIGRLEGATRERRLTQPRGVQAVPAPVEPEDSDEVG